jgi:hypothetical protein
VASRRDGRRPPRRAAAASSTTLRDAASDLLSGITCGTTRTRDGGRDRPPTECAHRDALNVHVIPELGRDDASISRETT